VLNRDFRFRRIVSVTAGETFSHSCIMTRQRPYEYDLAGSDVPSRLRKLGSQYLQRPVAVPALISRKTTRLRPAAFA
jgi:hypothetical protein